jgi:hypothetical protein
LGSGQAIVVVQDWPDADCGVAHPPAERWRVYPFVLRTQTNGTDVVEGAARVGGLAERGRTATNGRGYARRLHDARRRVNADRARSSAVIHAVIQSWFGAGVRCSVNA